VGLHDGPSPELKADVQGSKSIKFTAFWEPRDMEKRTCDVGKTGKAFHLTGENLEKINHSPTAKKKESAKGSASERAEKN